MSTGHVRRCLFRSGGAILLTLCAVLCLAAPASAASVEPLFVFSPQPPSPAQMPPPPTLPPTGYLNGPCGLTLDSFARPWVSDYYHRSAGIFSTAGSYTSQPLSAIGQPDPHTGVVDDPCGLALDSAGTLYVNNYHRDVARFPLPISLATGTVLSGSDGATGVAVYPVDDHAYVDVGTQIAEYDASGSAVQAIGAASLGDGYGIAVSGYSGTAGYLYVPDASTDTVKVYDPATDTDNPVATITGPPGGFTSLRDSSVAVDDVSGEVYVLDNTQPSYTEEPRGRVDVFDSAGNYEGHLKYDVIDGAPSGIAVDNSGAARYPAGTGGRVYITTGNTHQGGGYVYPPDAATSDEPLAPKFHPALPGSPLLFPTVSIGGPGGGAGDCEGDACQVVPSDPGDPTLTTLLSGHGNPKPHYVRYNRAKKKKRHHKRHRHHHRQKKGHKRKSNRGRAAISSATASPTTSAPAPVSTPGVGATSSAADPSTASAGASGASAAGVLLPGTAGFAAAAWGDGGGTATQAGSHPYQVDLSLGLDQSSGEVNLRSARFDLPPGLLLDPANGFGVLCSTADFLTPRSTPFAAGSESGESCPDQSQVGTIEVTSAAGGGKTRTFGLYNREPDAGSAAKFGASPFGYPLDFEMKINADVPGAYMSLKANDVPLGLALRDLKISLWGVPWDASHNSERGDCLNEADPAFAWGKCSVGEPLSTKPRAFITMPSVCGAPLSFDATVGSWQQGGEETESAESAAPVDGCASLHFALEQEGQLTVKKASSASGYNYRFYNDDQSQIDPRGRTQALVKLVTVALPQGVTLNPSVGAGLGVCTPGQLAAETPFNAPGAGCPNASKIGDFLVKLPYYKNELHGSIYLAQSDNPATSAPGAENPFDSLLAVYLVAKSADRGMLFKIPGKLTPNPGDGTLTATFDNLPQLPYTNLGINFRSGQRAPLISPPHCGAARSAITLTPWAAGVPDDAGFTDSQITTGIDQGPCPDGSIPPFAPGAVTGGVNANVGSYTPYYVHLSRKDTEQEITSYSLILPKGITGKLAGIPFCGDAAIEASRHRRGAAEEANPSCPEASLVGHTLSSYGVGAALTYATGRVYLAGPYHGAPLSLVTMNSAKVGPFDLGTIVIRSAFQVDEHTAQLRIDSSASDPIPHIRDGVPLHLRDVRIYMDRFQFTHNPSSCEPSELISTLTGSGATYENPADDSTATVAKHFQLLNCLTLGFRPKLGLRLRGSARRGGYPSLRANFVSRGAKDSNLKRIEVLMPHSLFLAQNHIRKVCTGPQFDAGHCPKGSIYGTAVAKTLLFDEPLRGKVYLRSSTHKLPDLVADLYSGAVRIVVEGKIRPSKSGGIDAFFDNLPDAPIDSFTMVLRGGRHGLLQNSANICANPPVASVKGLGQNNRGAIFTTKLRGQCAKKHANHKGRRRGRRR